LNKVFGSRLCLTTECGEWSELAAYLPLWIAAGLVAFGNGANDISKTIATLVGSGEVSYRRAVTWGAIASGLGAFTAAFLAEKMVGTFAHGYLAEGVQATLPFVVAVALGAVGWLALATRTGMPVSTTHSLVGAIVVAGAVAYGPDNVSWGKVVQKFALPLLLSPFLSLMMAWALFAVVRLVFRLCHNGACRACHWVSSLTSCFARAFNDIPKIVGVLSLYYLAVGSTVPSQMLGAFAFLAVANTMGALIGGLRVTETLAYRVTEMDHDEGLTANLTTALLVVSTGIWGLPVSTTHVSSGAILGVGLRQGWAAVRWATVRDMALAWLVTLPVSGIFSLCIFLAWTEPAMRLPLAAVVLLGLVVANRCRRLNCPSLQPRKPT
jgi:PiT family inorganic phosphate transporter